MRVVDARRRALPALLSRSGCAGRLKPPRGAGRAAGPALGAFLLLGAALCASAPLWAGRGADVVTPSSRSASEPAWELPREWDGQPLRPLALSAVEQRFAAQFPGRIARLTDGDAVLIWRRVERPTRLLHPAADCYRALGYRIENAVLEDDAPKETTGRARASLTPGATKGPLRGPEGGPGHRPDPGGAQQRRWRCFEAARGLERLRVCERIEDARGVSFTDASSWYWAAQLGNSTGPWLAVTVTRAL